MNLKRSLFLLLCIHLFFPQEIIKVNKNSPKETKQLSWLLGKWDCVSEDLLNSVWYTNKASWEWHYILDGHALQNHWWQENNNPAALVKEYFVTGIFIFNPNSKLWEAIIIGSRKHKIPHKFTAVFKNKTFVMSDHTKTWRVTFYDIQEKQFHWKYETLTKEKKWLTISKITAKRV